MPLTRRNPTLAVALALLAAVALVFQHRQNVAGGLGGPISLPKLLWLATALATWYVVPFFFWRSPAVSGPLRRVYAWHLSSFAVRGVAELVLILTVAWIPPYGIAHDVFTFLLITGTLRAAPAIPTSADTEARRFLVVMRAALACEVVFAWLFHRTVDARTGIYFASSDPSWRLVNGLTTAALAVLLPALAFTLWAARDVLFPVRPAPAPLAALESRSA